MDALTREDLDAVRAWLAEGRHPHGGEPDCWVDDMLTKLLAFADPLVPLPDSIDPVELEEVLGSNEALLADGFEDALIGWVERFNTGPLALYDRSKCIQILMERDEMSWDEAEEFFQYNVTGAWVGDGTPAFAVLLHPHQRLMTTTPSS